MRANIIAKDLLCTACSFLKLILSNKITNENLYRDLKKKNMTIKKLTSICFLVMVSANRMSSTSSFATKSSNVLMAGFIFGIVRYEMTVPE